MDSSSFPVDRYSCASLIPLVERGEPLVDLAAFGFKCVPVYFYNGWTNSPRLYARQAVAEKLAKVQARWLEPLGLRWLVWDAWRSRETQTAIYQHYWRDLSARHPAVSAVRLQELVHNFVTIPNRADYAPPHTTGGAVDLGLWNVARQEPLWLGADFDEFVPDAASDAFEKEGRDPRVRDLRRLMATGLAEEGFSGDPHEYFHKEYGSQRWAANLRVPVAFYGEVLSVEQDRRFAAAKLAFGESDQARCARIARLTSELDLSHPAVASVPTLVPPAELALRTQP